MTTEQLVTELTNRLTGVRSLTSGFASQSESDRLDGRQSELESLLEWATAPVNSIGLP
jgi:hypothetical protein